MRLFIALILSVVLSTAYSAEPPDDREKPRLKFKRGPVCMCMGGLSEQDIRESEQRRALQQDKDNGTDKQQFELLRQGDEEE